MQPRAPHWAIASVLCSLLAACGGGSGSNPQPVPPPPPPPVACRSEYSAALGKPVRMCLDFDPSTALATSDELFGFERLYTDWRNNATLTAQVATLVAGKASDRDKVIAIANWVHRSRPYATDAYSPVNRDLDLDFIVNAPRGICFDAAFIGTAMLRIAGIPALENFVGIDHANTLYRIDGKWRVFDATFCNDPAQCPDLSFDDANDDQRIRFFFNPEGKYQRNGSYCEGSYCQPKPFTTNKLLPVLYSTPTRLLAWPASTITSNQEVVRPDGSQIEFFLEARGLKTDPYGGVWDIDSTWGFVDLGYSIGDLQAGYMYATLPARKPSGEAIAYRYVAREIIGQRRTFATYEFTLTAGPVTITAESLVKTAEAPDERFQYLRAHLRKLTSDLGLTP